MICRGISYSFGNCLLIYYNYSRSFYIIIISGYSYVSPTHEVKRLAKEIGMEGKVRVMNFGVPGQMCEVRHALEDCIQNGYWLLLQNYHLAEEPEQEFYILLKVNIFLSFKNK